jgi:hypothetical protein
MYDIETRRNALRLVASGRSLNSVSRETRISRATLRSWRDGGITPVARAAEKLRTDGPAYPNLLGLYLGDGCLSAARRGVHVLRITCANSWPGLADACEEAIRQVRPFGSVYRNPQQGCVQVTSWSKRWPEIFPQHGPGRKHERRIALEPWQQAVVDTHPWEFVRGLFHSDGCRITNWTVRTVGGVRKRYEYPRYFFTNTSTDIIDLYTATLDTLGVRWTRARNAKAHNVSVARRESVGLMEAHVGAKY